MSLTVSLAQRCSRSIKIPVTTYSKIVICMNDLNSNGRKSTSLTRHASFLHAKSGTHSYWIVETSRLILGEAKENVYFPKSYPLQHFSAFQNFNNIILSIIASALNTARVAADLLNLDIQRLAFRDTCSILVPELEPLPRFNCFIREQGRGIVFCEV